MKPEETRVLTAHYMGDNYDLHITSVEDAPGHFSAESQEFGVMAYGFGTTHEGAQRDAVANAEYVLSVHHRAERLDDFVRQRFGREPRLQHSGTTTTTTASAA